MSVCKRSFPVENMCILEDSTNLEPGFKKRCIQPLTGNVADVNKVQDIDSTMDWQTADVCQLKCQETGSFYMWERNSKDRDTIDMNKKLCHGVISNCFHSNKPSPGVCVRCLAGEPGHISHIDR